MTNETQYYVFIIHITLINLLHTPYMITKTVIMKSIVNTLISDNIFYIMFVYNISFICAYVSMDCYELLYYNSPNHKI